MVKASKIAALTALLFLLLFFIIQKSPRLRFTEETETLSEAEYSLLREGDFVFRLGYGIVSFILESQTGASGVSHIGILVKDTAGFDVIHSISGSMAEIDGVQKNTLDRFLYEARPSSFVATRLKNSDGEAIAKEARRLLAKRVPFDLSFNIKDTNKLFCSSLANLILKNTHNLTVYSEDAKEFPFNVFFDTTKFEIVMDKR
ncbi:MAG: hypothetical protein LBC85_07985 [Fibromonadaceae bacterium]|jgi:hypothetical protein|nr:hypothetical protein [Fibromonadaceae bacterium]